MPAFVKTKADEKLWQRAKKEYKDNTKVPNDESQWTDKDWATVTTIFKNIRGGAATRLARIKKCLRR